MYTHTLGADSRCYMAETNTTLESHYSPTKKEKDNARVRARVCMCLYPQLNGGQTDTKLTRVISQPG